MRLIKPKAELLLQQPGLEGVYKQIELAGRTCYKSEDKITDEETKNVIPDKDLIDLVNKLMRNSQFYLLLKNHCQY